MTIVYLKLILAAVITAIPLFYEYYVQPKEKTSKVWRNMFTAIGSSMPFLSRFCNKVKQHAKRFADGMRKSDNFRKFFTYIVLLILIVIQFVDLQASLVVVQGAANMGLQKNSVHAMNHYLLFGGFYTSPFAYLITGVMSLVFFFYRAVNYILTTLHNDHMVFYFFALFDLAVLFTSTMYFIVSEVMLVIMIAAVIYPNKEVNEEPLGRKPIPVKVRPSKTKLEDAA